MSIDGTFLCANHSKRTLVFQAGAWVALLMAVAVLCVSIHASPTQFLAPLVIALFNGQKTIFAVRRRAAALRDAGSGSH